MENDKILIQINNVSFKYPTGEYLFENLKLTVKQGDRTAIVGANGSGKSTILKILTGELEIEEGSRTINGKTYYVPQIDLTIQQGDMLIYDYISQYYEEWWDVIPEVEKLFNLTIDPEAQTKILSGGELMKLNLAIAIKHSPDVLILDEPTNHLDVRSVSSLINFIKSDKSGKFTYVIVSHDTYFLDQVVTTIWELNDKKVTAYGGNYSFYKEQKELHLRGIKRQYEIAKTEFEKAQALEQKEIERTAKRANEAKRAFMKGSLSAKDYEKGKEGGADLMKVKASTVEKLKQEAEEKLEEYETEERRLAFINMKNTSNNLNRTIFEIKDGLLKVADKELVQKINLKLTYGDRILIAGDNGSGKTSLVKALLKKSSSKIYIPNPGIAEVEGEVYVGENLSWVFIDQHYSLIDPTLSLIQNLMKYNPEVTESKAKEQLGKFQFKTDYEYNKPASDLSGGEMVRLIMAMITSFPIDLIILDEPTNNLDVETVDVLVKSLNNFRGAIIVISHNIDFITRINVQKSYLIKNNKLKELDIDLSNREAFFKALS